MVSRVIDRVTPPPWRVSDHWEPLAGWPRTEFRTILDSTDKVVVEMQRFVPTADDADVLHEIVAAVNAAGAAPALDDAAIQGALNKARDEGMVRVVIDDENGDCYLVFEVEDTAALIAAALAAPEPEGAE